MCGEGLLRRLSGNRLFVLASATAVTLALAACGSSSSSSSASSAASGSSGSSTSASAGAATGSPIKICELAANSGPFELLGSVLEIGVAAWANYENTHGGIMGHKVTLVKENDQSSPAVAAGLARKCVIQDDAQFIIGPESTSPAAGALPIVNSLHTVTLVAPSGWDNNGYSDADRHGYAFPAIGDVYHADDLAMTRFVIAPRHYTRVAVIQDNTAGGLGNDTYMASLGKQYGFSVVASQTVTPGSTNDTPAALKLLAAKPQAIILGVVPGPDTITAIKAIRAQDPTIPIGECSGCTLPSFLAAAGGYSTMKDVYLIGTPQQLVASTPQQSQYLPAINDTKKYLQAMTAAGYNTPDDTAIASPGWDAGSELAAAIETAHSTSQSAVRTALEHQTITVGGQLAYAFARTSQDYGTISQIVSPMAIVQPNGSLTVFKSGS